MESNAYGLNRSLGLAVAAIAFVGLLGSGMVLASMYDLDAATASRHRSDQVFSDLDRFRAAMLNQQTGVRGYLLTGRRESLAPYYQGKAGLDAAIGDLEGQVGADADQRRLLDEAERSARAWQADVGAAIVRDMASPATRARAMAIESGGEGKARFDAFRIKLGAIEERQRRSLAEESAVVTRAKHLATATLVASALLTLLICLGVGIAINRVIVAPLETLAETMRRLVLRDTEVVVPSLRQRNEVGAMARAVEVFRNSLIELDRTSVLRVTADTLPAMVGYVDAERRVGFLNEEFARWFDLGTGDVAAVYGQPLSEVFPERAFPGVGRELDEAQAGADARFALELVPRDGGPRDIEAYYRPHAAPDGRVLGVVTLLTDVTDRKGIDRQLRHQARDLMRSNEELEQFAYVASHDLKAPLRGIENLASWIEEDLGSELTGETRTNMDLLKSRVKRLESLLDDLLAYSRAGRDATVVSEVDTHALVAELATLVSPPEGFAIEGATSLPTLTAARAALTQVLQNLIGNAVKHHPDPRHGHVWVEAERDGDVYEFRVCDDGPGVPEAYRERVFGMFQTLKPRDEVEGSGMGLAIVRKLVERQGGKVWLSERVRGGLQAHFTWPVTPGGT